MNESVIAIVFDFDETLGPDTISLFLEKNAISPKAFWPKVDELFDEGWDPPLAYMHLLLKYSQEGKIDLSLKSLKKIGKKLPLFPGLPTAFTDLKAFIKDHSLLQKSRIRLEFYVISGGLEDMIRSTKLTPELTGIFGSRFAYDNDTDQPFGIKSAISFTEKTRFLHGIRKGVSAETLRKDPYRINDSMPENMQRVPFSRMIYIGDGPSDIPCLSPVVREGGIGIGATAPFGSFKKGYELARGKRIMLGPYTASYKKGSDMRKVLEEALLRIALNIDIDQRKQVVMAPGH
ncbi:HAD family hydrolase [soil metagenome]